MQRSGQPRRGDDAQRGAEIGHALLERRSPDAPVVAPVEDAHLGRDAGHPARGVVERLGLEVEIVPGVGGVGVGVLVVAHRDEQPHGQVGVDLGQQPRVVEPLVHLVVELLAAEPERAVVAGRGVARRQRGVDGRAQHQGAAEQVLVGQRVPQRARAAHGVAADDPRRAGRRGAVGGVDVVHQVAGERGLHRPAGNVAPGVPRVHVPVAALAPGGVGHHRDERGDPLVLDHLVQGVLGLGPGLQRVASAVQQVQHRIALAAPRVTVGQVHVVGDGLAECGGVRRGGGDRAGLRLASPRLGGHHRVRRAHREHQGCQNAEHPPSRNDHLATPSPGPEGVPSLRAGAL